MQNEQISERVDAMNAAARRKARKGQDWHPYFYERVHGGLIVKGCRAQPKTRGPNKGELRYFTGEDQATVLVTPLDVDLEVQASKFKLEKGVALVLVGPPDCGNLWLAKAIAAAHGTYELVPLSCFESLFRLGEILIGEPATLILDEFPRHPRTVETLKNLIASKTVEAPRKCKEPIRVTAPNVIICSGRANPLQLSAGDRRFRVVQVGQ